MTMPFMDDLNRFRMGNIYGGGLSGAANQTDNPFNPPMYDPNAQALSFIDQMRLRKFQDTALTPEQMAGASPLSIARGMQDSEPKKPMNTVFAEAISPLDQAKLDMMKESLKSKEDIAEENRQSREGIAAGQRDINQQKVDISQQRANAYDFKTRNPSARFERNKVTGELNAINPITGKIIQNFGKMQMGEEELANMNQSNKIEQINATGQNAQDLEKTRQAGRESLEEIKARHARELAEYNTGQPSKSANLPSQQSKDVENKYNILINKRPDLRKFVHLDPDTRQPLISEDANPEDYQYMKNFLFGSTKNDTRLPNESSTDKKPLDTKTASKPKILSITPIGGGD